MPKLHRSLVAASERQFKWGPDRMPGEWPLVYLAFVTSRIPDIQPWYNLVQHDKALWGLCGFSSVPAYRQVHKRLTELESIAPCFEAAAAQLIQKAHTRHPEVGAWWHIDATEAQTHATPRHDCRDSDDCPTRNSEDVHKRDPRMSSVSTEVAKATRQALAEQPIPASETTPEPEVPLYVDGLEVIPAKASTSDERRRGRRFTSGGHWWYTRDPHAGLRAYSRDRLAFKFWHGYLLVEVVDHFTHAPLASYLMPATRQEEGAYEDVFRQAESNLGGLRPFLVAGDRGYSYPHIYRFNTSCGVGSVFPYRKFGRTAPDSLPATPLADKNGVPLCQKCGSDTEFVRFAVVRGKGRIWFRCPWPGCIGEQSVLCEKAPRHLLPVWRTDLAYAAMRHSHWTYEHKHHDQRVNYKLGPSSADSRPKRPGIAWQQLRASAAMLIEWLRVFQRGGWDEGPSQVGEPVKTRTKSLRILRREAEEAADRLVANRDGPAPRQAA